MTTSFLNFKGLWARTIGLFLSVVGTLVVSIPVQAQSVTLPGVTVSSPTTLTTTPIAPTPGPIGLTVTGWNTSSGIGQGYNVGGDGKGAVTTLADGFFRLMAESYLTGNSNPNCTADCSSTQAKIGIIGEQLTGARATNQGVGTLTSPVSSVAGTNGMFTASLQTQWKFTPATTPAPTTP